MVSSATAFAAAVGRASSTAPSTIAREVDDLQVEQQLAGDDARDVEQVVDEPRLRVTARSIAALARSTFGSVRRRAQERLGLHAGSC